MKRIIFLRPLLLIFSLFIAGCSSGAGVDAVSSSKPLSEETYPDCGACHASQHASLLDPLATNGSGTAGKHVLHVSERGIGCLTCHLNYTNQTTHMNGTIDTEHPSVRLVNFDQTSPSGQWNRSADPRTGVCSSVTCHGAGAPDWYSASSTLPDCTVCHAGSYSPIVIDETAGGKHGRHVGDYALGCVTCHYGYTLHPTHMNGELDNVNAGISAVYFNTTIASGQWNSAGPLAGSCSNLYCHSDATSLATGAVRSNTTPSWYATGFPMACTKWSGQSCVTSGCHANGQVIDPTQQSNNSYPSCSVCHGSNTPATLTKSSYPSNPHRCYGCHNFPPTYATDSPKSNSHGIHAASSVTCNYCHYETIMNNSKITDTSQHVNGRYDVMANTTSSYAGGPVSFSYLFDIGGGTCSNISCHIAKGWSPDKPWGGISIGVNSAWKAGTNCNEVIFYNVSAYNGTAPYTYFWNFGDGTTSTEQNPTHIFPSGSTYTVTLTVRDANRHPGTKTATVTPLSTNVAPVANATASVYGWTVTLTDLSYDPDYNSCGHTGPGIIDIAWNGQSVRTTEAIDLTGMPSNKTYSYTYPSASYKSTYYIYDYITDNANVKSTKSIAVAVPSTYTIGGRIANSSGMGLANVGVYLRTISGGVPNFGTTYTVTNSNGYYTFSNTAVEGTCYIVKQPVKSGYTFTPGDQTVCSVITEVNFIGSP